MSGASATYGYNQFDQLTSYQKGSGSQYTYAYNGDGLRTSKTVNGSTESYVWDVAEGMPLLIQDGSTRYITGPNGLPIEQVDGSGNVLYCYQRQLESARGTTARSVARRSSTARSSNAVTLSRERWEEARPTLTSACAT